MIADKVKKQDGGLFQPLENQPQMEAAATFPRPSALVKIFAQIPNAQAPVQMGLPEVGADRLESFIDGFSLVLIETELFRQLFKCLRGVNLT